MMEGRLEDPTGMLEKDMAPRVRAGMDQAQVYGEKSVTYGPFIPYLYELFACKFVFLKRDGRDVVRSLVNWHETKFGSIYRECTDPGQLTPEANAAAARLPVHMDLSDYSRPRPSKTDPLYWRWEHLSRAEMCAYYWSVINELYVEQLERLPSETWIEIDYTGVTSDQVDRVAQFCGLQGLDQARIQSLLDQRINSLTERGSPEGTAPDWNNWTSDMRDQFDEMAGRTMRRLGYYREGGTEWRPAEYGQWWKTHTGGVEWYSWMYKGREQMHERLVEWVRALESRDETIQSIADFGCGAGVGYGEAFAQKRYVGIDLNRSIVEWCRANRHNAAHEYQCKDFAVDPLGEKFDVVFSSGTLDNTYDIDLCLGAMVRHSRGWISATFYRGWFEGLGHHRYRWSTEHTCFYNDASPGRIRNTLQQLGCRDITVEPIPSRTGQKDIPFETLVTARVPPGR